MENSPSVENPLKGLDALISHLKSLHKDSDPPAKRIPIVLVHGLFEWATPDSKLYHVFGPCLDLAGMLAEKGWPVIVPNIGPLSSTWERACELYASLTHESKDGKSFDIVVDYGTPSAATDDPLYLDLEGPNRKRQARAFNLDPSWRWGPENPVHFVAHGHGANTCRYLIYLLEKGKSVEGSWYFTDEKRGWVRSLTTLGAPSNGTTLTSVLGDLGRTELLINRLIAASAYVEPSSRLYDFALDHRGIYSPSAVHQYDPAKAEIDLGTYLSKLTAPDGALTKWRASRYNAFHDNSITGVVGGLNRIIGSPSEDVYYFSLSFVGTEDVLGLSPALGMTGLLSMGHSMLGGDMDLDVGAWRGGTVDTLLTSILTMPKLILGVGVSKEDSLEPKDFGSVSNINGLVNFAGSTLQDVALWALTHVNPRLPAAVPKPAIKTTRPRIDIWSPLMLWSFQMCSYVLTPAERRTVATVQGPSNCRAWHKHDGLVPTCSQHGPWGFGNKITTVDQLLYVLPWGWGSRRRAELQEVTFELPKGLWINLGEHSGMDHVESMGLFVSSQALEHVKELYSKIGELLEVLPSV